MAFPGFSYDLWCDCEALGSNGTAATGANLDSSSHGAAGAWNTAGTHSAVPAGGLLLAETGSSDGVTDGQAGTIGVQYASATGVNAGIEYVLPSNVTKLSLAFAYKTIADPGTFAGGPRILQMLNDGFGPLARLTDERDGGDNQREISLASGSSRIAVSSSTWYWITYQWQQSGTCTLKIYDTSLTLMGTCTLTDTSASTVGSIAIGNIFGGGGLNLTNSFDNFFLDTTNANFPLLPVIASGQVAYQPWYLLAPVLAQ